MSCCHDIALRSMSVSLCRVVGVISLSCRRRLVVVLIVFFRDCFIIVVSFIVLSFCCVDVSTSCCRFVALFHRVLVVVFCCRYFLVLSLCCLVSFCLGVVFLSSLFLAVEVSYRVLSSFHCLLNCLVGELSWFVVELTCNYVVWSVSCSVL